MLVFMLHLQNTAFNKQINLEILLSDKHDLCQCFKWLHNNDSINSLPTG